MLKNKEQKRFSYEVLRSICNDLNEFISSAEQIKYFQQLTLKIATEQAVCERLCSSTCGESSSEHTVPIKKNRNSFPPLTLIDVSSYPRIIAY